MSKGKDWLVNLNSQKELMLKIRLSGTYLDNDIISDIIKTNLIQFE